MSNFRKFKLPQLIRKGKSAENDGIPRFEFNKLSIKERIGQGSFGDVYTAEFKPPGKDKTETVVIKRMINALDQEEKKLFSKEVAIMNGLNHNSVVRFKAVCYQPFAMMLEYIYFDFKPFGQDVRVSALSDFFLEIDVQNCEGFREVVIHAAKEMLEGLSYLHEHGIAHRDLKSANILVSNQHYSSLSTQSDQFKLMYQSRPVACKLTDFGESRSFLVQTQTVLASKTHNVDRGTVVYMAPELLLKGKVLFGASITDLKLADIWALGMIFFTMINPSLKCPYLLEIRSAGGIGSQEDLKTLINSLMRSKQHPLQDVKYEIERATVWRELEGVYRGCVNFNRDDRFELDEASKSLKRGEDRFRRDLNFIHLSVSQATAVEEFDHELAHELAESSEDVVPIDSALANDGTNACAFLSVKVADVILTSLESGDDFFARLAESVEHAIWFLPEKINMHRDLSKTYDAMEAYSILKKQDIISCSCDISEELPFTDGVYSFAAREKLHSKLCHLSSKDFTAVFTSDPLVLTIGCANAKPFLIDTHPVSLSPGKGNGLVLVGTDNSPEVWMSQCAWLWERLNHGGVKSSTSQSLAVFTLETKEVAVRRKKFVTVFTIVITLGAPISGHPGWQVRKTCPQL